MSTLRLPFSGTYAMSACRFLKNGGIVCSFKKHRQNSDRTILHKRLYGLTYVVQGSGTYADKNGIVQTVHAGHLIQLCENNPCRITLDKPDTFIECSLTLGTAVHQSLLEAGILQEEPCISTPGVHQGIVDAYCELYSFLAEGTESSATTYFLALIRLIETLQRYTATPRAPWLTEACLTLSSDFQISLSRLAEHAGMSYDRFRKEFKKHIGVSPGEYRMRQKIKTAITLLATMSVKEVAYRLGYESPNLFSRQFKKATGFPPSQVIGSG